jgi:hypothetical protein
MSIACQGATASGLNLSSPEVTQARDWEGTGCAHEVKLRLHANDAARELAFRIKARRLLVFMLHAPGCCVFSLRFILVLREKPLGKRFHSASILCGSTGIPMDTQMRSSKNLDYSVNLSANQTIV